MNIKAGPRELPADLEMEWRAIASAPFERDLELAVIDANEIHALIFPCRRVLRGWTNAKTNAPVNVHPTHWRDWEGRVVSPLFAPLLEQSKRPLFQASEMAQWYDCDLI